MDRKQWTIYGYFWIFGLINNVLYVVILSAAVDIVGPSLPKTIVLLADITPSLIIKLTSPFFIDKVRYEYRIFILIFLSAVGMFMVSLKSMALCMVGIILASISSGFGEVSFLQLTHYFEEVALNGWSSGTGGAGIIGSGVYMLLTSILKIPVTISLLLFSVMPFAFLLYFKLDRSSIHYTAVDDVSTNVLDTTTMQEGEESIAENFNNTVRVSKTSEKNIFKNILQNFQDTLVDLRALVIPYMLPLTSVYLFEYLINQAVCPTLLFPLDGGHLPSFFHKYRDMYVTYGTLYQFGVFISRTLAHKFRMHNLYLLSFLQALNLIITLFQAWKYIVHVPWPIMILIFYEGLLGGASYVNTFLNIMDEVEPAKREFALGAVSIADSSGVFVAAIIGLFLEPGICRHQVSDGRPWCTLE
ncbi:hypothetical protein RNJ44_04639 [Nakaseomyces bracarensis]|uniref:Protein BTN n=1 Tax=Nakaseomyces bracarensis TaxID=273131 RepID=A0ABR4NVH8_9SACH